MTIGPRRFTIQQIIGSVELYKDGIMGWYLGQHRNRQGKGERRRLLPSMFCLALLVVCYCLACRPKSPAETDANTPQASNAVETTSNSVAVTVNGTDITEGDVQALVEPELEKISDKPAQLPPQFVEQYKKQLRVWALDKLIAEQLLDERAKQANIVVAEEEMAGRIEKIAAAQTPPLSLEQYKKKLQDYGQSFDQYKSQLRKQLVYEKLMQSVWAGKINVTQEDAKSYYAENKDRFVTPEQVRASHILIKPKTTEPGVDPNQAKAQARARAQALLDQIKAGADFEEAAKAHSDCRSSAKGGDLGFFGKGDMEAPFEKVAFELTPGQVSDIVQTTSGYHIVKVTDHKERGIVPFEQAKDKIMEELTQKRRSDLTTEFIESLKAKATIVYPPGREPSSARPASPGGSTGR